MTFSLKPCPFCGEIPYLEKIPMWHTYHNGTTHGYKGCYRYDIECHKCGCNIRISNNDTIYRAEIEAKQAAIDAWNTRA